METKTENKKEYRSYQFEIESRDDGSPVIRGHAAVFNTIGEGGWFREQIAPGAFKESIGKDDVRALFNHDANLVLGRNKSGTLRMTEDEKGLAIEIDPPDTQTARDLITLIKRGDISQMSFGFEVIDESWARSENKNDPDLRTLQKVKLWDVSPVTFPFYKETDVDVAKRSHDAWLEETKPKPQTWKLNLKKKKLNLGGKI